MHFTKFRQYQEGDPDDGPASGPEAEICAFGSVRGSGEDLIPKAIDPPAASELHPGFVFVTTSQLGIHFAH